MAADLPLRRAWLLCVRDVRLSAHSAGPIVLRSALLVALVIALVALWWERGTSAAPGALVVTWFVELNYWAIVACGVSLFPALLASEREQGAWALLRLAGCRPLDFLLGRSAGLLLQVGLALLAQAPFLWLAVALGGVDPAGLLTMVVVLLAHAIAVFGMALLAVALGVTSRRSVALAMVLVLLVTYGPELLAAVLLRLAPAGSPLRPLVGSLAVLSDHLAHGLLRDLAGGGVVAEALRGALVLLALGIAALALGAVVFRSHDVLPRRARAAASPARRFDERAPSRQWCERHVIGGLRARLVLAAIYGLALWWVLRRTPGMFRAGDFVAMMMLQSLAAMLHGAFLGARSMRALVAERTLPLLVLTAGARPDWLRQMRVARGRLLLMHASFILVTYALVILDQRDFSEDLGMFLLVAGCGMLLGDALGERLGLLVNLAPWAVSLLAVGAVVAAFIGLALVVQPRHIEAYFFVHALAYGLLAGWLYVTSPELVGRVAAQ